MNSPTLLGVGALLSGVVLVVFVYLLKTNIGRWYRWPLAGIAALAGYMLAVLTSKVMTHARLPSETVASWENATLTIVTMLVVVLPVMHWCDERHQRTQQQPTRRSHPHVNAHR